MWAFDKMECEWLCFSCNTYKDEKQFNGDHKLDPLGKRSKICKRCRKKDAVYFIGRPTDDYHRQIPIEIGYSKNLLRELDRHSSLNVVIYGLIHHQDAQTISLKTQQLVRDRCRGNYFHLSRCEIDDICFEIRKIISTYNV